MLVFSKTFLVEVNASIAKVEIIPEYYAHLERTIYLITCSLLSFD